MTQGQPHQSNRAIRPRIHRVVHRSLVLAALACRGAIDHGAGDPEAVWLHSRILEWLTELTLWDEVEPYEEAILRAALGTLESKEVIHTTWYVEGLAILAWAIKRMNFPPHDQQVAPYDVADSVLFLSEDASELMETTRLRVPAELEACHEMLYAIHVRLRDFIRNRDSKDFSQWIEQSWLDTLKVDGTHLIIDSDLAIDNRPIYAVDISRIEECSSMLFERRRAITWLLKGGVYYSQTPVDT